VGGFKGGKMMEKKWEDMNLEEREEELKRLKKDFKREYKVDVELFWEDMDRVMGRLMK
jgi:hypothetical protein